MSKNTTTTDVLEVIESPSLSSIAELDEQSGHGVIKAILIAAGIAAIGAAIATFFSRREG